MKSQLLVGNILRWIARVISIPLVALIFIYLLFVGLQVLGGESGFAGLYLYMLLLLAMSAGLVIAWWREGLGAILALVAIAGFFAQAWLLSGFRGTIGSSPFIGPLVLIVALIKPRSFDPVPNSVYVASWVIPLAPACLFFFSWLLRRNRQVKVT